MEPIPDPNPTPGFTKLQVIATLLGITAAPRNRRPWWIAKQGPIVRDLGEVAIGGKGMTLQQAVWKCMEETNLDENTHWMLLDQTSPRASIYMEIEAETKRQEANNNGVPMAASFTDDPREPMMLIMEQLRMVAVSIANPRQVVTELLRAAVLLVAVYEWSLGWFATLQKTPLDKVIKPREFKFPPAPNDGKRMEEPAAVKDPHACPKCNENPCIGCGDESEDDE